MRFSENTASGYGVDSRLNVQRKRYIVRSTPVLSGYLELGSDRLN